MDPDAALERIRELSADILNGEYALGDEPAAELAEQITGLDEWLVKGGFLPEPWQGQPEPTSADLVLESFAN